MMNNIGKALIIIITALLSFLFSFPSLSAESTLHLQIFLTYHEIFSKTTESLRNSISEMNIH
jgi:hypothetical protein